MSKSKYKLQAVLNVRDRARQEASRLLAARRAQLAAEEEELARRQQAVADCREQQTVAQAKMIEQANAGTEARQLVMYRAHLADLRRQEGELVAAADEQRERVKRAEAEVDKAIAALIEASKELQVMEKHRQSWREQTRLEEARREQKTNDEIGTTLNRRN